MVLGPRDPAEHVARRESACRQAQPLASLLYHALLVGFVVDDEVLRAIGLCRRPAAPQCPGAAARTQNEWNVEISGLASERAPTSESTRSAISAAALLVKVTARMESGSTPMLLDQVGDAIGDDARLAAARAGQDQHRPIDGLDRLPLLRIELGEERKKQLG